MDAATAQDKACRIVIAEKYVQDVATRRVKLVRASTGLRNLCIGTCSISEGKYHGTLFVCAFMEQLIQ